MEQNVKEMWVDGRDLHVITEDDVETVYKGYYFADVKTVPQIGPRIVESKVIKLEDQTEEEKNK